MLIGLKHPSRTRRRHQHWMPINAAFDRRGPHRRERPPSGCELSPVGYQVTKCGSGSPSEKPQSHNNSRSTPWKAERRRLGRNSCPKDTTDTQGYLRKRTRRNSLTDALGIMPSTSRTTPPHQSTVGCIPYPQKSVRNRRNSSPLTSD